MTDFPRFTPFTLHDLFSNLQTNLGANKPTTEHGYYISPNKQIYPIFMFELSRNAAEDGCFTLLQLTVFLTATTQVMCSGSLRPLAGR